MANEQSSRSAEEEAPPVSSAGLVARLTNYAVKPQHQAAVCKALSEYVLGALKANGNLMAEAYLELDNPNMLWVIERWDDANALEAYQGGGPAAALAGLAALEAPPTSLAVRDLEPLSKAAWRRAPAAGDRPLTVLLFVDARPGTGQEFKKRYRAAMPRIRAEAGVVTYQLTQVEGADDRFVTYEKFRSEQALQDHLQFPFLAPILDFLHTSITNPPFEQGLRKLTEFAPLHWE